MNIRQFAVLLTILCVTASEAAVWKGGTDTSWNTAANWEPATVPNGSGAEADLSAASGTITVSSAVTIGRIVVGGSGSLTLGGQKITFAGTDKPEVNVGAGRTFYQTTMTAGDQGLRKTGAGTYAPSTQGSGNSFSGGLVVEAGACNPVKNGANNHWCGGVEVLTGASFKFPTGDMFSSSFRLVANGGTIDFNNVIDYAGPLEFSNGGLIKNTPLAFIDNTETAVITANGTGYAGMFNGGIGATAKYGAANTKIDNRTIQVNVANAGATFTMTGRILDNRLQASNYGNDLYHAETDTTCNYRGQLRKIGNGDLLLYDETISLSGPTSVDAGRLVLSNAVKMSASAIRLATGVNQLVLAKGATLTIGSLTCTAAEDLDLSGNAVDLGGTAADGEFAGTFSNGSIRKVGNNTQTLGLGQTQKDWDVLGGTLAFGLPAPLVHYSFDDAENLGKDDGSLAKMLEASGEVRPAIDGVRGGCAELAGGYLTAAGAGLPSGNGAFSISAWIKPTSNGGGIVSWGLLTGGGGYNALLLNGGTKVKHTFWEGVSGDIVTDAPPVTLKDGSWHHVVMTYEPSTSTRRFYADGQLFYAKTDSTIRTRAIKTDVLCVGYATEGVMRGKIDEVSVYGKVLTSEEVAAIVARETAVMKSAFAANGTVRLARSSTLSISGAQQSLALVDGPDATLAVGKDAEVALTGGENVIGVVSGVGKVSLNGGSLTLKGVAVDAALKNHLVAYWNFDDPTDPGKDASGNGMTVKSYATTGTGNSDGEKFGWRNRFETLGGAAYFDGVDNHHLVLADTANHAKLPNGNASFTTAAWFNPASNCSTSGGLLYWGNGKCVSPDASHRCNGLRLASATTMTHYFWSNDLVSRDVGNIRTGEIFEGWHHVAVTYDADSKQRKIYYDGVQVASDTISTTKQVEAANFMIGCSFGYQAAPQKFMGYLDDVMIFDMALTAEQVKAISRGIAEVPVSGPTLTAVAGTALNVTDGTVALGDVASAGTTMIADGAKLILAGEGRFGALSGAGTLAVAVGATLDLTPGAAKTVGALALSEGAVLKTVASDSESTPAMIVEGSVQLPAAATVKIVVSGGKGVRIPLFKANGGLTGSVTGWTVELTGVNSHWMTTVSVVDNVVYVQAYPKGLILIFK